MAQAKSRSRAETRAGASQSRAGLRDRLSSYLSHHRSSASDSLKRLLRTPAASLMTWTVIAIALVLPTALDVMLDNLKRVSQNWDGSAQVSLFLHQSIKPKASEHLIRRLQSWPEVGASEFISREQALLEFQAFAGFGDVLSYLDDNPLPPVVLITPKTGDDLSHLNQLLSKLEQQPEVEHAILDMEWMQRLTALLAIAERLGNILAWLLALGVLLVVGNTIRLAIESRRDEIVVIKLVGGTSAFIRRPFLYSGFWYGLGGGLIAWLILTGTLMWLKQPITELTQLYQSDYKFEGLTLLPSLQLISSAALLGIAGAWFAVSRNLKGIEPK